MKNYNLSFAPFVKATLAIVFTLMLFLDASAQRACIGCSESDIKKKHPKVTFERITNVEGKVSLIGNYQDITYIYFLEELVSHSMWLVPETADAHRKLLNMHKDFYSPEENVWKDYLDNGEVVSIHHIYNEEVGWFFLVY